MPRSIFLLIVIGIQVILLLVLIVAWVVHARRNWSKGFQNLDRFLHAGFAKTWHDCWGETYGPDLKRHLLEPLFSNLEAEDKIGSLIMDVGSGAVPVTRLLQPKPVRKRICVDIAADNAASPDELRVRLDIGKLGQPTSLAFRKASLRICAFLGINPATKTATDLADLMLFSDVLNYVDFWTVLHESAKYLKPGGRIIVVNLPHRGNQSLFSDKGLKNNRHLYACLYEHHFEIESKAFPKRARNETDESEELIVLVARKCI
ncbi:MAG: hypothetical protein WCD79_09515 [Chthoniobacteraceae bacterium]